MKNWKFDLFNFKQGLTLEQLEISSVVEKHIQQFENFSEKEITYSLKETLKPYAYDTDVISLLESMEEEIKSQPLLYELKNLYKIVERKQWGTLYKEPLNKILDAINKDTDEERMSSVVNDLSLYDWVPEIKSFVVGLTTDPTEVKNLTSNGAKSSKVYTVVEEVENGHIAYVGNRWFLLGKDEVGEVVISDYFKGEELTLLQNLEKSLVNSTFEEDQIKFFIDDNLCICVGTNGKIYINDEEADKETTLEDLFNSPMIPMMKKNLYLIVKSVADNLDKIVELDVVTKITNLAKPLTELYLFNYKSKLYLYSIDKRTGSSFFEYDSVTQLIEDVQRDMGYDVSDFVSNKLSKELKQYKKLEDKEKEIESKIKEVQESLESLESEKELLAESADLRNAFDDLILYKQELVNNLNRVKNAKNSERKRIN